MKFLSFAYTLLQCLGIPSRKSQTGSLLTQQELNEICKEGIFQMVDHPLSRSHYVLCLERVGIEGTCGYGKCFSKQDPKNPCAKLTNCPSVAVDADIKRQCQQYNTPFLRRVPDPNDLKLFFVCYGDNFEPMQLECPPNQYYSEKEETCSTKIETSWNPISKRCDSKHDGQLLSHHFCFQYYRCHRGSIFTETCPYGKHFDPISSACVGDFCEEDHRKPDCENIPDHTRFPHKYCDCYYVCLQDKPVFEHCPGDHYFDAEKGCLKDTTGFCEWKVTQV